MENKIEFLKNIIMVSSECMDFVEDKWAAFYADLHDDAFDMQISAARM